MTDTDDLPDLTDLVDLIAPAYDGRPMARVMAQRIIDAGYRRVVVDDALVKRMQTELDKDGGLVPSLPRLRAALTAALNPPTSLGTPDPDRIVPCPHDCGWEGRFAEFSQHRIECPVRAALNPKDTPGHPPTGVSKRGGGGW